MVRVIEATEQRKRRDLPEHETSISLSGKPESFDKLARFLDIDLMGINTALKEKKKQQECDEARAAAAMQNQQQRAAAAKSQEQSNTNPLLSTPGSSTRQTPQQPITNAQHNSYEPPPLDLSWDPYGRDDYFRRHPGKYEEYRGKFGQHVQAELTSHMLSSMVRKPKKHEHISMDTMSLASKTVQPVFPRVEFSRSGREVKVARTGKSTMEPKLDPVKLDLEELLVPINTAFLSQSSLSGTMRKPLSTTLSSSSSQDLNATLSAHNNTTTASAVAEDYSLLSNNFAGIRAIKTSLDETFPSVYITDRIGYKDPSIENNNNGGGGLLDDDDVDDTTTIGEQGANEPTDGSSTALVVPREVPRQELRLTPYEMSACENIKPEVRDDDKVDNCALCHWREAGRTKRDQWENLFLSTKVSKAVLLEKKLRRRAEMKSYVQCSTKYLANISGLACHHAEIWQRARDMDRSQRSTVWVTTGATMRQEQMELESCGVLWTRVLAYLGKVGQAMLTEEQETYLNSLRRLVIEQRCVSRQLFFDWLLTIGPKALESRDLIKIVHYVRMDVDVSTAVLGRWIRLRPQRLSGWKQTAQVV
eukprot:PhM_4_TR8226/c0_g1_i2/m.5827